MNDWWQKESGDDFDLVRKKYFNRVKSECETEYKCCLNPINVDADRTLGALHLTLFASIASFQKLLSEEYFFEQRELIQTCCTILKSNCENIYGCFVSDTESTANFLRIKYNNLISFIKKQIEENENDNGKMKFLCLCAEILDNSALLNLPKTLLHHKHENLVDQSFHTKKISFQVDPDVETDGRICAKGKDPPGQKSAYIPPGEPSHENYRLSTYLKFPIVSPANPRNLASVGFYYTGYKDRVKCFCCGRTVENWMVGDNVTDAKWHEPNCKMARGEDCGNVSLGGEYQRFVQPRNSPIPMEQNAVSTHSRDVATVTSANDHFSSTAANRSAGEVLMEGTDIPVASLRSSHEWQRPTVSYNENIEVATITSAFHENLIRSLDLRRESDRLRSFDNWPRQAVTTVQPRDLAKSGFFYLGNADRVQCFSCGGVLRSWKPGENVDHQHLQHFPQCRMARGEESRNTPINPPTSASANVQQRNSPETNTTEQESLRNMFPCLNPINPHMRSEQSRRETFDRRWPATRVRATPQEIARAGFYFLGERDRVKCWYCNGGLQNWELDDQPWTEHAKWFPECEFLLQSKGPDFSHRIVAMYPHLLRPVLRSPHDVAPTFRHNIQRDPSPPIPIIDPRAESERRVARVSRAMQSDVVKQTLLLGFQSTAIERCLNRRLTRGDDLPTTVSALVDELTADDVSSEEDDETQAPQQQQTEPVAGLISHETATSSHSGMTLEERMKQLELERQCKVCMDNPADVVFIPCSHLCCCVKCAQSLRRCPVCRAKIAKAIKTYVS